MSSRALSLGESLILGAQREGSIFHQPCVPVFWSILRAPWPSEEAPAQGLEPGPCVPAQLLENLLLLLVHLKERKGEQLWTPPAGLASSGPGKSIAHPRGPLFCKPLPVAHVHGCGMREPQPLTQAEGQVGVLLTVASTGTKGVLTHCLRGGGGGTVEQQEGWGPGLRWWSQVGKRRACLGSQNVADGAAREDGTWASQAQDVQEAGA